MDWNRRGIVNLGNSCYQAAVLQALASVSPVVNFFKMIDINLSINKTSVFGGKVAVRMKEFLEEMFKHVRKPISIKTLQKSFGEIRKCYTGRRQEDAHEFIGHLLSWLHEDFKVLNFPQNAFPAMDVFVANLIFEKDYSFFRDLFSVELHYSLLCTKCNYSSLTSEVDFLVSLPLPIRDKPCSIDEIMSCFCAEEELDDCACSQCGSKDSYIKQIKIQRLPPILILHLKRFEYVDEENTLKNHIPVRVPFVWTSHLGTQYELVSAVQHHGQSVSSGHYTAVCKSGHGSSKAGNWWCFCDDTSVRLLEASSPDELNIDTAVYIVVYSLKDEEDESPGDDVSGGQSPSAGVNTSQEKQDNLPEIPTVASPCLHENISHILPEALHSSSTPLNDAPLTENTMIDFLDAYNSMSTPSKTYSLPFASVPLTDNTVNHNTFQNALSDASHSVNDLNVDLNNSAHITPQLSKERDSAVSLQVTGLKKKKHKSLKPFSRAHLLDAVNRHASGRGNEIKPCCPDPTLDEIDPVITVKDVPGSKIYLNELYSLPRKRLLWLLKTRGLPLKGRREVLIERLLDHVNMGKGNRIDPKLKNGKFLELKRKKLAKKIGSIHKAPIVPITGWKTFTSCKPSDIFGMDAVINYAIQRAHQLPSEQETEENEIARIEEECFEENAACDNSTKSVLGKKKFKTIPNPLNRGIQFLTSCRIQSVWDQEKNGHYFVKANVEPSMHGPILTVTVTLSTASGYVCEATCSSCKQRESFRCSHICAVLLLLAGYGHDEEVVTTTGRPQYWGKGGKRKDPGLFHDKQYYTGIDVLQRSSFDPRPKAFHSGPSTESLEEFKKEMEGKSILSLQMSVLSDQEEDDNTDNVVDEPACMIFDKVTDGDMDCIKEACIQAFQIMASNCNEHFPSEIVGTENQGESELWHLQRSVRATASEAKVIFGLGGKRSTDEGKKNFLRRHMWRLNKIDNLPALQYGRKHETDARNEYTNIMRQTDPNLNVLLCGMWVNPRFPQLSCSPDGLITDANDNLMLLEIKCPLTMQDFDPNDFDKHLTKKQIGASFLKREKDGTISLKTSSKYYYQVQMALDILELQECHFVVWSPEGVVILRIPYNSVFWEPVRDEIIKIHRKLLLPEFFLKNAFNDLPPLILEY